MRARFQSWRASMNRKLDAAIHFELLSPSEGGSKSIACRASPLLISCVAYSTHTMTSACGSGRWRGVPQGTLRHAALQTDKLDFRTRAGIVAANSPTRQTPHSCGLLPCFVSGFSLALSGSSAVETSFVSSSHVAIVSTPATAGSVALLSKVEI